MHFGTHASSIWATRYTSSPNSDKPLPRPPDRSINNAVATGIYSSITILMDDECRKLIKKILISI